MSETNKTEELFGSGSIKWSDLRENFKGKTDGTLNARELYREAASDVYNSYVPDADENASIPAMDSGEPLSMSDFRDTVKEIVVEQSGRNANYDAAGSTYWGGNLDKNVKKLLRIKGQVYSEDATSSAMSWSGNANNVDISVHGSVTGMYGLKGTASRASSQNPVTGEPDGQDGGPALEITGVPESDLIEIKIDGQSGTIRGGGGGGAAGIGGVSGEDGLDGADGSDGDAGADGPANTNPDSGNPGGGGSGGLFGSAGQIGQGGIGYNPGVGPAGDGGDSGDGGDGGDGGRGGTGGDPGADGADGARGADGSPGKCQGVTDQQTEQACGDPAPACPSGWESREQRDSGSCGGRMWDWGGNQYRTRTCRRIEQVQVSGGQGGDGGEGGSGGTGGSGGRGGNGGRGGSGGRGGRGGAGGAGGNGGNGKGWGVSYNTAQKGQDGGIAGEGQAGADGGAGQVGGTGSSGSRGGSGGYGGYGQQAEFCPGGWSGSAQAGEQGKRGEAGEQGKTGQKGQDGQPGEAGQAGQDGTAGQKGTDGADGGDYGADGGSTPYGNGGTGGKAIAGDGGYYITQSQDRILGATENSGSQGRTSGTPTTFVNNITTITATLSASSTTFNEGESIDFTIAATNCENSTTLYFSVSGFALGPNDLEDQPTTNDYKTGIVNVQNNTGTFTITSKTDEITEEAPEKEFLVALRLDGTDGEILDYVYITLQNVITE